MSNMSYCRFQNTYGDAAECLDALEQQKELSGDEYNAARNMFLEFSALLCRYGDHRGFR